MLKHGNLLARSVAALLLVLLAQFFPLGVRAEEGRSAWVLALTDYHGALEERDGRPGLAKLTGAVTDFRREHPDALLVAVGDLFTGEVESDLLRGKPVLEGLLAASLRLSAVGNHEYDWDGGDIARWSRVGLPFVSANIRDAHGKPPEGVEPFRILESGGLRIAFVGLTTTATPRITRGESVRGLNFMPPGPALREAVAGARQAGADAVVVLAHLSNPTQNTSRPDGICPAITALAEIPGVSAVVYGHSHEEHLSRIGQVPVVQPAYKGGSLAVLELRRDSAAPGGVAATARLDRLSERGNALPADARAADIVRRAKAELGAELDKTVGYAEETLTFSPEAPSLLGEVICDALRAGTGAQAAIINGGGPRGSLDKGDIALRDLYRVLPFNNTVRVIELNGAEMRRVLEYGIIAPGDGDAPGSFVQMSGLRVRYDLSRPKGRRIVAMTLSDGAPVTKRTRLRLAVNSFLSRGGDGYPLARLGRSKKSTNTAERDMVRAYLEKQGVLRPRFAGWLQPE